jgi:hypothetical protein
MNYHGRAKFLDFTAVNVHSHLEITESGHIFHDVEIPKCHYSITTKMFVFHAAYT